MKLAGRNDLNKQDDLIKVIQETIENKEEYDEILNRIKDKNERCEAIKIIMDPQVMQEEEKKENLQQFPQLNINNSQMKMGNPQLQLDSFMQPANNNKNKLGEFLQEKPIEQVITKKQKRGEFTHSLI
jgi:hypothetical protein